MLEFTGERVVPGLVDPALFDEHRARYRFARQFARRLGPDVAILDAGCGTGYGTAEFSDARSVTAFDLSPEAVRHARDTFAGPRVHYLQAACEAMPFADGSFDLVLAFEVIEHLGQWQKMLTEAKRVLKPAGVLLVSTPNRAYYAESRASVGPNPFHVREFDRGEFTEALETVFPHVALWTQNHVEGLGFLPFGASPSGGAGVLDAPGKQDPENAYFFLGACSSMPVAGREGFAYIPLGGNLLRDREHHIALLSQELEQKTSWLEQMEDAHSTLNREHKKLLAELEEHNTWAAGLNEQIARSGKRIVELQNDLAAANSKAQEQISALERSAEERLNWVRDLEAQIVSGREERLNWVRELESQIATGRSEVERLNGENTDLRLAFEKQAQADEADKNWLAGECQNRTAELAVANKELARIREEHARYAAELRAVNEEMARFRATIAEAAASKWMKLGRAVHLGPELPGDGR